METFEVLVHFGRKKRTKWSGKLGCDELILPASPWATPAGNHRREDEFGFLDSDLVSGIRDALNSAAVGCSSKSSKVNFKIGRAHV